jgi:tRNA 2-thiouridine synthesizing protein A
VTERLLDLRGLRCPWPALRVARAVRDGNTALVAVSDEPRAPDEIAAVAAAAGWRLEPVATALGPGLRLWSEPRAEADAVTSSLPQPGHSDR